MIRIVEIVHVLVAFARISEFLVTVFGAEDTEDEAAQTEAHKHEDSQQCGQRDIVSVYIYVVVDVSAGGRVTAGVSSGTHKEWTLCSVYSWTF